VLPVQARAASRVRGENGLLAIEVTGVSRMPPRAWGERINRYIITVDSPHAPACVGRTPEFWRGPYRKIYWIPLKEPVEPLEDLDGGRFLRRRRSK